MTPFSSVASSLESKGWIGRQGGLLACLDTQLESVDCRIRPTASKLLGAIARRRSTEKSTFVSLLSLGSWYGSSGRPREALKFFTEATRIRPKEALSWYNAAVAMRSTRQTKRALLAVEKSISLKPSFAPAWMLKASVLHLLHRTDEALLAVRKAMGLRSSDPSTWLQIGFLLDELAQYDEAKSGAL